MPSRPTSKPSSGAAKAAAARHNPLATLTRRVEVLEAQAQVLTAGKAEPESYRGPLPRLSTRWEIGPNLWLVVAERGSDHFLGVGVPGHWVESGSMPEPELRTELARWARLRRGEG